MKWEKFKSFLLRYAGAFIFVASAFLVTHALWEFIKPISSPLFLGAVMLSAWLFGFRPGVFASVLSAWLIDYVFITPAFQISGGTDNILRLSFFIAEGAVISWLISAQTLASEKVKNSQEQLLALSLRQQTLREAEQKRIALEIHDELGQALTGLKMNVHWINRRVETPEAEIDKKVLSEQLTDLQNLIDSTISSVRRIATELRPAVLDDFGLIAALEWQAQDFERKTGISCLLDSDVENLDVNSECATAVFRIFQETLTNIIRHADASSVKVNFETSDKRIIMHIEDNGKGIDSEEIKVGNSLGILGMHERARLIGGEIKIFSGTSGGTTVKLTIPFPANTAGEFA